MGVYEDKQAKEREALDKQFIAEAGPIAERLIIEIEKAAGIKPKKSIQEGSHTVSLYIDEPRISIEIQHDWGTGHRHWGRQPTGKPKIRLNNGYGRGNTSWYRPNKEGAFNIEKIVKSVAQQVEGYKQSQKASKQREIEEKENKAVKAQELEGVKLPDGAVVNRDPASGQYSFRFGGTFHGLDGKGVATLTDALNKLSKQYNFEKSWRMDY